MAIVDPTTTVAVMIMPWTRPPVLMRLSAGSCPALLEGCRGEPMRIGPEKAASAERTVGDAVGCRPAVDSTPRMTCRKDAMESVKWCSGSPGNEGADLGIM